MLHRSAPRALFCFGDAPGARNQYAIVAIGGGPFSTWVGKACAWSVVVLTFFDRLGSFQPLRAEPAATWVLDAQIMLYGVLFMMAGLHAEQERPCSRDAVRILQPRTQAIIDLTLYIIFLPGVVALTHAGWTYANESLAIREQTSMRTRSRSTFKFVIPAAGFMLLLQGIGDHPLYQMHPDRCLAGGTGRRRSRR
jgi:TRAP-type mannitol/chloroaromatic compound transport system permease small subunit